MGKPKAPEAPNYAAAAAEQGKANVNSAIASNYLNQVNQSGPYGSLTYSYDQNKGYTLPDGTKIPGVTATTTLDPAQQKLLDQNNQISTSLNTLAQQGIGYVGDSVRSPIDQSKLPSLQTGLGTTYASILGQSGDTGLSSGDANAVALRDKITSGYMERLQPYLDKQRESNSARLANQGITQGSEAYGWDQDIQNRAENDQRIAALLAGDQQQQNLFQQGLASGQFTNQARQQAIQEADYFKNQPLNMLNALRSGNQTTTPQFGNVAGGAQINAAPIYQATNDQYPAALQKYKIDSANSGGILGGLASLGGAAITKFSDRRLKRNIEQIGKLANGLKVYAYNYIWSSKLEVGVMADEVAKTRPEALGPTFFGYATVNYGALE